MTPLYKPINFIPVNSQNCVVHVCQMVLLLKYSLETREMLLSISKVILTTEQVITATLKSYLNHYKVALVTSVEKIIFLWSSSPWLR